MSKEAKMTRRKYSSEEKVKLLKRHLLEGEKVSSLCKEADIHPNLFSKWKKSFFEKSLNIFDTTPNKTTQKDKKIEKLEAKLTIKNDVLAELMEEHIMLKKSLGEN